MIAEERRQTAGLLETLDDAQWETPSLCEGWTVRTVAAHLTSGWNLSLPKMAWAMVRHGGFDKANDRLARGLGEMAPDDIVAQLRANADHRFTPPGMGPTAPLSDLLVHGQDIRRPLGLHRTFPADRAAPSLDFLTTKKAKAFNPPGGIAGLRFVATDLDWAQGEGPEVRGTGEALLLTLYARPQPLDELDGDGVDELRGRFK
jgi:uncharacterized protein (TIGR03083 family)